MSDTDKRLLRIEDDPRAVKIIEHVRASYARGGVRVSLDDRSNPRGSRCERVGSDRMDRDGMGRSARRRRVAHCASKPAIADQRRVAASARTPRNRRSLCRASPLGSAMLPPVRGGEGSIRSF